jgi:hypothetical protein
MPSDAASSVLRVDALYRNTNEWTNPADEFNRFFRFQDGKGVNNVAGFRPKSRAGGSTDIRECAFCLLVTNFGEEEWPDRLDRETGLFTYYGDNKKPGRALEGTPVGGNKLLEQAFRRAHNGRRHTVQPFLAFESFRAEAGMHMRFLGLAAPGAPGTSALEDLVAVWRFRSTERFQNYRSLFTILREEVVQRTWLEDLVSGVAATDSAHCPPAWRDWAINGHYRPLSCEKQVVPRSRRDQLPHTPAESSVLERLLDGLDARQFEYAARDIVQLMDNRFTDLRVTRAVRDGGRDVVARYRVGHDLHQVHLEAVVEAKRWAPDSAVGVKPMMRLLSRLKHRDIGVFVTTSFFDQQVQQELIDDRHPVLLITGGDVARLLIACELGDTESGGALDRWMQRVRSLASPEIVTL